MEYLFIYLLQVVGNLEKITTFIQVLFFFSVILFIISMFLTRFKGESYNESDVSDYFDISETTGKYFAKFSKKSLIATSILLCVLVMLPTKQTLVLIGGVYYGKMAAKQVITSEKIKKVNEIIDLKLDGVIKDLKNNNQ